MDDMTWNGTPWDQAALKANLTVRAMRLALKRPPVLKYLRAERGALLASASGQNLHALQKLRGSGREPSRGCAGRARALEGLASEQFGEVGRQGSGGARAGYLIDLSDDKPGLTIVIRQPAEPRSTQPGDDAIDITPEPNDAA